MELVVVEDSELVLAQLLRIIAQQPKIKVVGTAPDEDGAVRLITQTQPDAVLLDLALLDGTGIGVLSRIRESGNCARVLVLTSNTAEPLRHACEMLSISGFYDKNTDIQACMSQLFSWLPR